MQFGTVVRRLALSLAVAGVAAALSGCESFREALGSSKAPPDEFAVVTAAPLVVPPDYNLRPPEPGAPARNLQDPSNQARAALYSGSAVAAAAQLGAGYSDGEKMLLARSGAANVDPSVRAQVSSETRYEVGDPGFTDRVLAGPGAGAPAPAPAAAPAVAPPPEPQAQPAPGQ